MSQGLAHFLIDQLGGILRETLRRMDHLPGRLSEEMLQKLAEEEPQDLAIDATERAIERPKEDPERQKRFYSGKKRPYGEKRHSMRSFRSTG